MNPALRIVLVGTQHPGNIGSAARAMKTMGLDRLLLVTPQKFPHAEANALAAGADDVLERAEVHDSLASALAGCRLVFGTSARRRSVPLPEFSPRDAARRLVDASLEHPVALVFGRERTGLENEELQCCHASVCIPANPDYSSLNLASAVQVLAYELRVELLSRQHAPVAASLPGNHELPASAEEMERYFIHLAKALDAIDFHKGKAPEVVLMRLRRLYLRARPDSRELRILHGILSDTERMARLAGLATDPPAGGA
jgi:TrmH family RNA methyltransferase